MTPEEFKKVSATMIAFKQTYQGPGIYKGLIGQPSYEPGEKLLLRLPRKTYRRMASNATQADVNQRKFLDNPLPLKNEGTIYATNTRLRLVGNFGKVLRDWLWNELAKVTVIYGYAGVKLVTDVDDSSCEVLLHVYNKALLFETSPPRVALQCLKLEAAWILATDADFESWLSGLPARAITRN